MIDRRCDERLAGSFFRQNDFSLVRHDRIA